MILSEFSESLAKVRGWEWADRLYDAAHTPRQRLLVAAGVLSGVANATGATPR